ncbi:DUF1638 domain-containing protein [Candidatus Methanomassiliicoccus intestinalis]|uniref:DUF1638 domain-containing protein n=1 Tax=Candidatus Methanomassiliicoccus intestinalis TaxID=1406512 RepID=UPI0037DDC12B
MRIGIIACDSFKEEINYLTEGDPDIIFKEYLQFGLHEHPDELKSTVIDHVNALQGKVDAVFLGYGWCQSLKGITSQLAVPTVMIEADDCVCALLTPEGYAEERHKCAGTYYATPYFSKDFGLDRFYNKFCDQLGEELLNELGFDWFMQKMFDGYSRCLYINTGIEDRSTCEENAKKFASYFGWNYETRHGTLKMIEDALAKTKELASIQ